MSIHTPVLIEFMRRLASGETQQAANRVQLEDDLGTVYNALNPFSIGIPAVIVPTPLNGSVSAVGPTAIVAAPVAGTRIVVIAFVIQNKAATANDMQIHMGAATEGFDCLGQNQGDGLAMVFPKGDEWRGAAATALSMR